MRDPNQKMRYSQAELSLMKNTFGNDDTNIYALRKHMLGAELTEAEQKFINSMNDATKALVKKVFMPEVDADSPLFVLSDMALGLKTELNGKSRAEAEDIIDIKKLEIDYTKARLDLLDGKVTEGVPTMGEMTDLSHPERFVRISARNFLLSQIDTLCMYDIKLLSNKKDEETIQQAAERMMKDSTK